MENHRSRWRFPKTGHHDRVPWNWSRDGRNRQIKDNRYIRPSYYYTLYPAIYQQQLARVINGTLIRLSYRALADVDLPTMLVLHLYSLPCCFDLLVMNRMTSASRTNINMEAPDPAVVNIWLVLKAIFRGMSLISGRRIWSRMQWISVKYHNCLNC